MNMLNYLDLWDVLVNELFGGVWIFIFVGLAILFYVVMRARMPDELFIVFGSLFLIIIYATTESLLILWIFIVLIVGLIFYYKVSKAFR